MAIDPFSDRPVYHQVADVFRDRVRTGRIRPGVMLPSEHELSRAFGIGREAVRQAMAVLRGEGLVETSRGVGTVVRRPAVRAPVALEPGMRVWARMPSDPERVFLGVSEGVPVLVFEWADGRSEIRRADLVQLVGGEPADG